MSEIETFALIIDIAAAGVIIAIIFGLIRRLFNKERGSNGFFLFLLFALAFTLSLFGYLYAPIKALGNALHDRSSVELITTPITDAIKMFTASSNEDYSEFLSDLSKSNITYLLLYVIYMVTPFICFGMLSYTVVSFFIKTYTPKIINGVRWFFICIKQFFLSFRPIKAIYRKIFGHDPFIRSRVFIFTDAGVDTAVALAENLSKKRYGKNKYGDRVVTRKGDIVTVVVPNSSMRTQEGTEFRDKLILKGLDVITENVSYRYLRHFFRRRVMIFKSRKRLVRTVAYSMFYDDKDNVAFAKRANDVIYALKEKTGWHAFKCFLLKLCHYVGIARPANPPELVASDLIEQNTEASKEEKERQEQAERRLKQKNRKIARKKYRVMTFARIIDVLEHLNEDIEIVEKSAIEGKTEHQIEKAKERLYRKGKRYFNVLDRVQFYISCQDYDYDDAYPFIKDSFGMIKSFSEYEAVSTDFLLHTPITTFLDDLKDKARKPIEGPMYDMPMNIHFIGFGRVNRAIFTKMTSAYQLCRDGEDLIHYHIVDKDANALVDSVSKIYRDPKNGDISFEYNGELEVDDVLEAISDKIVELLKCKKNDEALKTAMIKAKGALEYAMDNKNQIADLKQTIRGIFYSVLCELKKDEYVYADYPKMFTFSGHQDGMDLAEEETIFNYFKDEFGNAKDNVHILNKSQFNVFIVSVGSAELNIKIAHTLRKIINAYSTGERKSYIYAFANNGDVVREQLTNYSNIVVDIEKQKDFIKKKECQTPIILFGNSRVLADYQIEISGLLERFGSWENFMYAKTRRYDAALKDSEQILSRILWNKGNAIKNQASNIYSCLTLGAKLEIAGYELSDNLTFEENSNDNTKIELSNIVMETHSFLKNSGINDEDRIVRDNIMRMEHNRWLLQVAFIEKMLPLPITTFLKQSQISQKPVTKGHKKTRHACIVSNNDLRMFEGVMLYASIAMDKDGKLMKNCETMHKEAIKLIYDNDLDALAAAIAFSKKAS